MPLPHLTGHGSEIAAVLNHICQSCRGGARYLGQCPPYESLVHEDALFHQSCSYICVSAPQKIHKNPHTYLIEIELNA